MSVLALGDSLAAGAWPGVPRPWLRDPQGVRLAGVPVAWLGHPAAAYPALVGRALGVAPRVLAAAAGTLTPLLLTPDTVAAGVRTPGSATPALRAEMERGPTLVMLSAGANDIPAELAALGRDARLMRWAGVMWRAPVARGVVRDRFPVDLRDTAIRRIGARLDRLLELIVAPGRTVVMTTYPVGDGTPELRDMFVGPVNAMIRAAGARHGARVADLEVVFRGHDRRAPRRVRWVSRVDGMHPVAEGHRVIAREVLRVAGLEPVGSWAA